VDFMNSSLLIWIVIAAVGLLALRFVFKVTKKIITLAFMIGLAVALYLFITQNILPGASLP